MRKTSAPTIPAAGLRLLLIDDNKNGLLARKLVLEAEGFLVTPCSTPAEALERFRTVEYNIVVTDFRMPGMNGIELLQEFRKIRTVPVVLVSGMVEVLGLTEANTGADAVVAKNDKEISNMLRAVTRLTAQRKPAGSQAVRRNRKIS